MSILTRPYFVPRKNNGVKWEPDDDTVLWLPGQDDPQSATIRDRSGNGNDGTIVGATWKQLPSGVWVVDFDGADDKVEPASQLNVATGTLLAWVEFASDIDGQQTIFAQDVGGNNDGDFTVDISGSGGKFRLRQQHSISGGYQILSDDVPSVGGIALVGMLFGTGGMAMNINGVAQADTDVFEGGITNGVGPDIGGFGNSFSWSGFIGFFRILSKRLTTAQFLSTYNQERHLFNV